MESKRSFWQYLKSDLFSFIGIMSLALLIGGGAYYDGIWPITYFMGGVVLTYFIGSYLDWKKNG